MKPERSFAQYRSIDLSLMALILLVLESVITLASGTWFPAQLYTVSIVGAVTAIVMMRWGAWAAIHAVLGGLIVCVISHADGRQYLIYCAGNLFALAAMLFIRAVGKKRIGSDPLIAMFYGVLTQVLIQAGRAAVAMLLGTAWKDALGFFTTDSLSILFTMVILWIARKQDGMLEDQRDYLHRIKEEERAERM